jgi:phage/plasmid-associated DNA primase
MIPFVVSIPEVERDKNLEAKLLKEKEGILA